MSVGSNRERILAVLRISAHPLDDDQLSDQAEVRPRQAVNQLCRRLERDGILRRYVGADGKIVNQVIARLTDADAALDELGRGGRVLPRSTRVVEVTQPTVHARPPGSSTEQRNAERVMLDLLGQELGIRLDPATITVTSGERIEVDGTDTERTVLVECWAHQGSPKSAQRHKVLADAFKLHWISSTLSPSPRRILCLSDSEAAAPFLPSARSWAARALQDLDIDVTVVQLPDALRKQILDAQRRQYR